VSILLRADLVNLPISSDDVVLELCLVKMTCRYKTTQF